MLEVKKLNKSFGENKVLNDISFELKSGEIGVLLGKSGTGKTTILRCINGLEEFDSGEIIVDDISIKNIKDINKIRKKTGMVFQNFNLFPHMSVLENIIQAPISVAKISREESINTAKKLLKLVDLEDKINAYPFELSGGQKQRVAIARACALTPKVLCFDEPTSALDVESIKKVINIINELKNKKIAILIITHDIGFANEIGDKIINI
ncbi:amino acid ABC transporter ATP-binding protein [Romboutsia lituseburensis]|uniref:amino acid ABC transporter ATP-binding protein n=1 Tax=Romboutsia lituseburensis TaxID=1537 RepID=UPI00215A1653|nr:amino acid ABC transporter ATP-binding protein [Romboutsia lituseburensis]MCR8744578.1 amino acid ABC transporter ATP-binding protein [Romboutsia lituseburensis]